MLATLRDGSIRHFIRVGPKNRQKAWIRKPAGAVLVEYGETSRVLGMSENEISDPPA
jgi:hypothetical protein